MQNDAFSRIEVNFADVAAIPFIWLTVFNVRMFQMQLFWFLLNSRQFCRIYRSVSFCVLFDTWRSRHFSLRSIDAGFCWMSSDGPPCRFCRSETRASFTNRWTRIFWWSHGLLAGWGAEAEITFPRTDWWPSCRPGEGSALWSVPPFVYDASISAVVFLRYWGWWGETGKAAQGKSSAGAMMMMMMMIRFHVFHVSDFASRDFLSSCFCAVWAPYELNMADLWLVTWINS